jgi:hypothetical protein
MSGAQMSERFFGVKFPSSVLLEADEAFRHELASRKRENDYRTISGRIERGTRQWGSTEDQALQEYDHPQTLGAFLSFAYYNARLRVSYERASTVVAIDGLSTPASADSVLEIFRRNHAKFALRAAFRVFIGHGGSNMWEKLQAFVRDSLGHDVLTFESERKAGLTNVEILKRLLDKTFFALLVHTAEDETLDGNVRARQNVVHETGLFQGQLGLERAIVLREEGCEEFSNLAGVQEIRFPTGSIESTFAEVAKTLRLTYEAQYPSAPG